jgi:hypothetical protein
MSYQELAMSHGALAYWDYETSGTTPDQIRTYVTDETTKTFFTNFVDVSSAVQRTTARSKHLTTSQTRTSAGQFSTEIDRQLVYVGGQTFNTVTNGELGTMIGKFCIEGWVYIDSTQATSGTMWMGVAGQGTNSSRNCRVQIASNGIIDFRTQTHSSSSGNLQVLTTSGTPVTLNQWNLITCTYDQITGFKKIYINGVEMASVTITSKPTLALYCGTGRYQSHGIYLDGLSIWAAPTNGLLGNTLDGSTGPWAQPELIATRYEYGPVTIPAGNPKYWNGTAWIHGTSNYYWNGSAWVAWGTTQYWNGSAFVNI